MTARKILLVNGPNLDMLGIREPDIYGHDTLATLEHTVRMYAEQHDVELTCFQSNSEGKLIGRIHKAPEKFDGIVYNPGAHTHYSYALRDAVGSIDIPVVEVHISDVDAREQFRSVSVIAPACAAQVRGLGIGGYCRAIDVLLEHESLSRLGEDFESRFEPSCLIRIAGEETVFPETGETNLENGPGFDYELEPETGAEPEPELEPDVDPLAEYADAVAAVDAGMLSYERQNIVRKACEQLGLDALLIRDTSNIQWATSFDGVFDEERAHALLVGPERTSLHTDSRYSNAIRTVAARIKSDILVDDSRTSHAQFALTSLKEEAVCNDAAIQGESTEERAFSGRLGIEDSITYSEFVKMVDAFSTKALAPTADVILELRAVKDASEITRLRAAQAITDAAFEHIVRFMKPGMTEREVQLELEDYMLRHGADGLAFRSIVATGENGADPHAVPSQKRLEAGQCVVMDFGARAFGYCSDMTRMVFLGEPEGKMAQAWQVLRRANETVEEMLRPGVTGKEAHEAAERVLAEGGFANTMGHGLGHGVGLDCHELPVLNLRNSKPLASGNVVTVEPGIYLPGEFGMRLEDCGVITEHGYEVFSKLGHEMTVI